MLGRRQILNKSTWAIQCIKCLARLSLSKCSLSMSKRILPAKARSGPKRQYGLLSAPVVGLVGRVAGFVTLSSVAIALSVTPVAKPQLHAQFQPTQTLAIASLSQSGGQIQINGSVEQLFQSASFVGPTSNDKRGRLRPHVSATDIAKSFIVERTRIAALRAAPVDPTAAPQSVAPLLQRPSNVDEAPRISLAAIDPAIASAALLAIDQATPIDPSIPVPSLASEQLAYSRANTPTTEHPVNAFSERERWCLATGIYFEARGESYRGQVGVAQVIMNRVKHRQYPDTICGVVFQNQSWKNRCQFSFACDGIPERINDSTSWAKAREITEKVTNGSLYLTEVANATHYHANYVYPHWAPRMKRLTRIGLHIFYRFRS